MDSVTGEVNPVSKFQNCTADWFPDSRRLIYSSRPGNQEVVDKGEAAARVGQKENYGWTQLWMVDGDGPPTGRWCTEKTVVISTEVMYRRMASMCYS